MISLPLIPKRPRERCSEFWFERHGETREGLSKPLLLQFGEPASLFLLGDEAVKEVEQVLIAPCDGPRRKRWSRDRLTNFEHGELFGDERFEINDRVDHVVGAAEG